MRLACLGLLVICTPVGAADPTAEQVFQDRLLPIFHSPNPSSCVQCHLAGVELKNYIRPSHRETFLSLRDQGLIDLEAPEKSRILALIDMGQDSPGTRLISAQTRKKEHDAFAIWLKASAADPALRNAPKLDPAKLAKPVRSNEIIRHGRTDRLLESFTNSVWAMRFRCMSCHTEGTAQNKKYINEHGERMAWFKADGPETTLRYLISSKLIDVARPEQSLLLRKPLNDVKHGGGQKFVVGDQGYKAYRQFLDDYAAIVRDKYTKASELPAANPVDAFGTEIWLKIENTPAAWSNKLLMVKIFAANAKTGAWEPQPIATTDRRVGAGKPGTPGAVWQHTLTLLADKGSERAKSWKSRPSLPKGRYLIKVFVDQNDRLAKDWSKELTDADGVGETIVTTDWQPGYGKMTVLPATKVQRSP